MPRTEKDRIQFLRAALQNHTDYWDEARPRMRRYKNAYMTRFYADIDLVSDTAIRVETADAYATIESMMGSLFTKYPSVEVGPDITGKGDAVFTKTIANDFLKSARTQVESAARMALIYTSSFLKLAPRESNTLLGKIAMRAIPPWQIIVDQDAAAWEDCRFVGHVYYLSVDEAIAKFGNKKFVGAPQRDYFTDYERNNDRSYRNFNGTSNAELPNEYLYIEVVEMYDLLNSELLFWSSHYKNGAELLSKDAIPVMTFDGRPLPNIVPFYFARQPDRPMIGYSAMSRVYDQCFEKNVLRTFWANAVRRDSRQFIYKEGAFDDEALAKITSGIDGAMIPTDNDTLAGLIAEVPVTPISSNHAAYLNYIESDLQKGSLTAGFTRGEASKATATEVTALMQYTASELGKMARDRDATIEQAVTLYIRMLIPLIDDGDTLVIATPAGASAASVEKIDADWSFYATDGGGTPMTDMVRKQQLTQLLAVLPGLGVPADKLRAEVVRLFDLPEAFNEAAPPPAPAPEAPAAAPGSVVAPPEAAPTPSADTAAVIGGV